MDLAVLRRLGASIIVLALAAAAGAQAPPKDLSGLSMDDLMNTEVTSVARHSERLSDTAAAVFVISREDIERSGATTIPEALRMAPGVEVASVDGAIWAVSARGFNGRYANKMLVMIDGRTVYNPVFSGIQWNVQDTLLEDIDRIEVIRGPGGTLWGANAVNGVINIITRNAIETPGTVVSAGAGTTERGFASARYGGASGDNVHFRVFAKAFDREANRRESVGRVNDAWNGLRAGFRADWIATAKDSVAIEGEIYRGRAEETIALVPASDPLHSPFFANVNDRGGDAILHWTHTQSKRSETSLQAYVDYADNPSPSLAVRRRDFDVDFQHQLSVGTRQSLVWGLGYRRNEARTGSPLGIASFPSPTLDDDLVSGFVQDEVRLPHDIRLTIGSKVEHDDLSGYQAQPTIRVLWRPSERQALWAAATNAVRTPSWVERSATVNAQGFVGPDGQPGLAVVSGDPNLKPEREMSYETGYRWLGGRGASIDVATFFSKFKEIINNEVGVPYRDSGGRLILPLPYVNSAFGHSEGVEISASDRITNGIDLRAGYTWLNIHRHDLDGDESPLGVADTPSQQLQLRAFFTISPAFEVDTSAYYVSPLRATGIPAYVRFDLRLAWHASPSWDFSLVGQNLFDDKHREFAGGDGPASGPINRSVYGKITWHSH
jgi:iron complex outermembrane recepter protein